MKKTALGVFVLLVLGIFWYANQSLQNARFEALGAQVPADATYFIADEPYTLSGGVAEKEAAPGSASKVVTRLWGDPVYGDLNGDDRVDALVLLSQETGGSGTFYYAALALKTETGYVGTNTLFLGDRVAPQTLEIHDGRALVNYAVRGAGENFSTEPSIGKTLYIHLDPKTGEIGELVSGFEGEADPKVMKLDMKTWSWIHTNYNNDTTVAPVKVGAFTLSFSPQGTFSATTDCNRVSGAYRAEGGVISFSKIVSTEMYCAGSQEREFVDLLSKTQGYSFTSRGELVFDLVFDSGSAVFR